MFGITSKSIRGLTPEGKLGTKWLAERRQASSAQQPLAGRASKADSGSESRGSWFWNLWNRLTSCFWGPSTAAPLNGKVLAQTDLDGAEQYLSDRASGQPTKVAAPTYAEANQYLKDNNLGEFCEKLSPRDLISTVHGFKKVDAAYEADEDPLKDIYIIPRLLTYIPEDLRTQKIRNQFKAH